MAWTTPRSYVPFELVTAAILNVDLRDNPDYLRPFQLWTNVVSPADLTANQNNWAPGIGSQSPCILRVGCAGATYTITGLANPGVDGFQVLLWYASGANAVTLAHEDAGSSSANRFTLPGGGSVTLGDQDAAWMIYTLTTQRWRVLDGTS